ncbi:MAG: hypothetical protein HY707_10680 [Ignavibacteriae bacterium]|nr:hypothetical protein [Ignavibacteriota bacterium]
MLRSVIDDYLTSTKELQFFLPFMELLQLRGFYDVHLLHGATEYGKDVIAKFRGENAEIQYSFQVKAGDVNLSRFRSEVQPQLVEALTNKLSHPNFDRSLSYQVIFVCTGAIQSSASIAFQEFNQYVRDTLRATPVQTWEKPQLTADFLEIGIDPFFELHRSPEFAGRFFKLYSQISSDDLLSFYDIEAYTKNWLDLEWTNSINRLQVFFEAYFFSKLLYDKGRHYEASLILASLVRVLTKNRAFEGYCGTIQEYSDQIVLSHLEKAKATYDASKPYLLDFEGVFAIFYHPLSCLRSLELLSLFVLTSSKPNKDVGSFLLRILDEQKGSHRIISDNYAITIVLVSMALLKLNEIDRLKRFLNNACVWLCDRYGELGIAPIGTDLQGEIEQLLSEQLEGLSFQRHAGGFSACACLDMSYIVGDKSLFEGIANDLRAVEAIFEFYHILTDEALFIHDHEQITTSTDGEFSLEHRQDYSKMIAHESKANSVSIRDKSLLYLSFLLRDRYFPTFITEVIN